MAEQGPEKIRDLIFDTDIRKFSKPEVTWLMDRVELYHCRSEEASKAMERLEKKGDPGFLSFQKYVAEMKRYEQRQTRRATGRRK